MPYLVIWQVVHVASGKTEARIYQRDLRGMLSERWCQAPCLLCRSSTRQRKRQRKRNKKRQCLTKAKSRKKTSLSGRWWFAYHHPDNDTDKIRLIVVGWSTRLDQELTCIMAGIFSDDFENWSLQCPCILYRRLWKINSKIIEAAIGNVLSSDYDLSKTFRPRCFWQICTVFPSVCKFSKMSASQPSAFSIGQFLLEFAV